MILPIRAIGGAMVPAVLDDVLGQWAKVASDSHDACLVLDDLCCIAALSAAGSSLVGEPASAVLGRSLLDVVQIVDFTEVAAPGEGYKLSIPPIAAVRDNHVHRSLLRLRRSDGERVTLDAISAPIRTAQGQVAGSITFFAPL